MRLKDALSSIVEKHRTLDGAIENEQESFISDWNGSHPFVKRFLSGASLLPSTNLARQKLSQYAYFDNEPEVIQQICDLHAKHDGIHLDRSNVIAGAGASSFLVAFSLWLMQQGHVELCYVPPLYYTFHYFLRMLSFRLRPVSGKHLFERGAAMNLPLRRSVLLLCDPIWFAGCRLDEEQVARIARWQRLTGSIIFIDGSFQYMQWDRCRCERSAILDPDLTFRLIAPTKSLGIPAFRFAYLILPARHHEQLLFLYESMMGGVNITDVAFAKRALHVLGGRLGNRPLTDFLRKTYHRLERGGYVREPIAADCGYFVFAIPTKRLPGTVRMTQEYFELKRHPNHVRINLLIAANVISRANGDS